MKVFCVKCGAPQDFQVMPAGPIQCPTCGHTFSPVAAPQQPYAQVGPARGTGGGLSGIVIALIVVGVLAVPCIGIMAAIAIPNFIKFQSRSKQSECKSNLKAAFTAEKAYFIEKDKYSEDNSEVGFQPEHGNRYAYFIGTGAAGTTLNDTARYPGASYSLADVPPIAGATRIGVSGRCPDCKWVGVCVGNIDSDGALDVWSVSTEDRTAPDGSTIYAGQPYNDVNDVTN